MARFPRPIARPLANHSSKRAVFAGRPRSKVALGMEAAESQAPVCRPRPGEHPTASKTWARHLKAKPSLHMFSKVLVHTDTLVSTYYKLRLKCTGHSTYKSNIHST